MASGGRVLHHLKSLVTHHNNSIVFLGFQAPGTRGDALVNGVKNIKIHGHYLPVKADIYHFDSLSAHADYQELMGWLKTAELPPKQTFIVHGEPVPADSMRRRIQDELNWNVSVPEYLSEVDL
jgi:metallo-beta-lactamase family protein